MEAETTVDLGGILVLEHATQSRINPFEDLDDIFRCLYLLRVKLVTYTIRLPRDKVTTTPLSPRFKVTNNTTFTPLTSKPQQLVYEVLKGGMARCGKICILIGRSVAFPAPEQHEPRGLALSLTRPRHLDISWRRQLYLSLPSMLSLLFFTSPRV
jgi:hypothetical protein